MKATMGLGAPLATALAILVFLELIVCEESKSPEKQVKYGYQDGDITQGVGYGHHLHPFYYRGKLMKYYDCAIEDEWRPLSVDQQQKKVYKSSPPKKYDRPKKSLPGKTSRNDRTAFSDPSKLEKDHAKFISEINGMSERRPMFPRYRILVPELEEEMMDSENHHQDHSNAYRVYEHSSDAVADAMKPRGSIKIGGQTMIPPFQRYKKFRVITVKPPPVVKVKRIVAVPTAPSKPLSDSQVDPRGRLTPQTFGPNGKPENGKDKMVGTRKGRNFYPPRPQLTMLEQFLILFPKLI